MGTRNLTAQALLFTVAACGGGGGGAGNSGNGNLADPAYGVVLLLSHSPAADEVQVAVDTTIVLEFDSTMALDSFGDEDTWLRKVGTSQNVPGTFTRGANGRVAFAPAQALELESDYVFQLSALSCDEAGRILDVTTSFGFRTFDATPPSIAAIDVVDNSTNQGRTRTYTVTFSEAIARASVIDATFYLRDSFGIRYAAERTVAGAAVTLDPHADLPGDRQFYLVVTTGLTDRAGNALGTSSSTRFRTEVDSDTPSVLSSWPPMSQTEVSPRVQPTFRFDESMDPATVEAVSLLFQDQYGSVVPFAIESSLDQRVLRVRPTVTLVARRNYTLAFLLGGAAATDVSGNALSATQALLFTTGDDAEAPVVNTSSPVGGETRVPGTVIANVVFSEAMDSTWVADSTVSLVVGGEPWTAVIDTPTPASIRITPVLTLPTNSLCTLTLRGGHEGLRDLAGNVLAADAVLSFTTSTDADLPRVMLLPPEGSADIAPSSRVSVIFDAPMDPATLNGTTVAVLSDVGVPLPGQRTVTGGNRVVSFVPATPFAPLTYYRIRVLGGSAGARRSSGNWFPSDQNARFRTGQGSDTIAPVVTATVNGIHQSRLPGVVVPPSGFTIDVSATDTISQWVDMGSVEVNLQGNGSGPGASTLLAAATLGYGMFQVTVPSTAALSPGDWTMTVNVRDLSGNVGTSAAVPLAVVTPTASIVPFERTQLVWVRSDLDRDGSGVADFDDDMLRLGLATAGDPIGTNTWVRNLVLDGILAQGNHLYGRGSRGEPIDGGSVGLRFTKRQPIGLQHVQMALGGFDPEGNRQRVYGDESTGILGRAYYDYRNGNVGERNTSTSPGLGIFPGEMWLYQTRIHIQVWPAYQTTFAQKFRPLCPDMGGTPAGAHALDPIVLQSGFVYATATTAQRARWQTIMDAADDWASVMGIILAHEVGHSVGLVAPGAAPGGLFGDSSLHDTYAGAAEVMAAAVGYEAMITLDYQFRDIDLAYLRQRVLLR